jgi:hypothetical protein
VQHLRDCGVIAEVLSPISDHGKFDISLFCDDGGITCHISGFDVDRAKPPLVWFRNKLQLNNFIDSDDQRLYLEMKSRQTLVEGVVDLFDLPVVNRGRNHVGSHEKISQMAAAIKSGFRTPLTIASTRKSEILRFVSRGPSISKSLGKSIVPGCFDGQGGRHEPIRIMTQRITAEEIAAHSRAEIASIPLLIQEEIKKAYELRVLAVGGESFAFKIDSQRSEHTALDWRMGERDLSMYSFVDISSILAERVRMLLAYLDLDIGVLDLAVCDNGDEIFFECNPVGQWMALNMVEGAPDLPAIGARHFVAKIETLMQD